MSERIYTLVLADSNSSEAPLVMSQDDVDILIDLVRERPIAAHSDTDPALGTLTVSDGGPAHYRGEPLDDDTAADLLSAAISLAIDKAYHLLREQQ
jgi:hypothetical protein